MNNLGENYILGINSAGPINMRLTMAIGEEEISQNRNVF